MNMQDIATIISGVGFPIVCSLIMFWQNHELNKSHKEESNMLKESIDKNTLAINTLVERFNNYSNNG